MIRSLLFVPGDSKSKLQKARQISADALILDWEDAVLPQNKILARKLSLEFLSGQAASRTILLIRVNSAPSPCFAEDCLALESTLPDAILLSKCRSVSEVHQLNEFLAQRDANDRVRIYPQVESPLAILNAFAIATSCPRVAGLVFGAEDFSADMGITRTEGEVELLYARSALVTASRAAGRDAIDSPCLEWKAVEKLRADTRAARNMGFSGKLAIHPEQLPVINEMFSPSAAEVERARRILAAFSGASSGVLTVDGSMVDEAVVRRARQILEMAGESFS
jgi:citrate lyase subunit beta/citryl-CoA lyase